MRAAAILLVAGLAWTSSGCGSGDGSTTTTSAGTSVSSDPRQVGESFVKDLAAGRPQTCDYMTPEAVHEFSVFTGETSCEAAVKAREELLPKGFPVPSAQELVAHLDQGKLTKEGDTMYFTFPTLPQSGERLTLTLVRSGDSWQVSVIVFSMDQT
jgi:hypothetical protein